ncbi:MAG TPA: glutamate synthase large subunit [Candidatus Omnitrophica bacterium]|nr:glutamate synthase large subunit [Candidatus Omnitrophota bacterium]
MTQYRYRPKKQGLYDPQFEHDSCGVGFVCNVKGKKSNAIIKQGLEVLRRLSHRGATGADPETGDGAGILIQIPHNFFKKVCAKRKISLPEAGEYGTGMVFLPTGQEEKIFCKDIFEKVIQDNGQILLGWREIPVDSSTIGRTARATQPGIEQVFIARNKDIAHGLDFERKLYVIRKQIENSIFSSDLKQKSYFYITNISSKTFSYKGLLMPNQLERFFHDLVDESLESAICLVHSRYSTNTFPTWDLSQPFRFLAHNGEINTLRGNINWMKAREGLLKSKLFGKDIESLKPVITPDGSDSMAIDNIFELLVLSGRSLPHTMMMLMPGAWEHNNLIDKKIKDFYKYHACLMEPWDGPAAIAFSDGVNIGAVLDRNGLRPARYIVTKDDFAVMASESGVLDIKPEDILISGRLEPGKIFFIDTEKGRIINDSEIKNEVSSINPYGKWIKDNMVELEEIEAREKLNSNVLTALKAFGYTREDLKIIIQPMLETGKEPIGSMGNDTPHAIFSKRPQLLYAYFKQLFAQVTNPAIDPIREKIVMSLESYIGPEGNLLDETPEHCHKLRVKRPILTNEELEKVRSIKINSFKTKTISMLFSVNKKDDFIKAIDRICKEAVSAIKEGYTFIILSDRGMDEKHSSLPALLAVGALHHHLVKKSLRNQIGIIMESGEPREVHHFALLFGYGADCVNSYLAYEAVKHIVKENGLSLDFAKAVYNYIHAVEEGILKILSKMGISTLQSYRGAQIFEALGLGDEVIEKCFAGTASRIGGADFGVIKEETLERHRDAYPERTTGPVHLAAGGLYQWRRDGEFHLWNPESISSLQDAARNNDYGKYKEFSRFINDQAKNPTTLRSLLKFKNVNSIPIEEVEKIETIVKRFATGAMSFGSIGSGAHETLAIAMNSIGGRSNTGEGGEDPARFASLPDGSSRRSAIKQVASGRFGVTTNYLVNADELQIKIAQGAKPGEGGQLPGHKVSVIIAATRYTTEGVTLISPPPHHDIYSIEDLAQLIFDLKNTNPRARISVKLVSEVGVGTIAAGVAKGHADMILISGGDGGTGASPLSSIKHAGLPWELGLSETHQTLVLNDLRSRVRLQTDGQMRTGRDVAIAALLGAEEFGFCTAALIVLGCVMLRHCHLNNCSIGIATQDEMLLRKFSGKPEHVVNYLYFIAQELREIMASLGVRSLEKMVGRVDLLDVDKNILPWKAKGIDFSKILYKPGVSRDVGTHCSISQDHGIQIVLDRKLIELSKDALEKTNNVKIALQIKNTDRSLGAMLSGELCRLHGEEGLSEDTIYCKFKGVAGQSFGAFLAKGITFELEGMANDYVGKGISGGKIIIYPDKKANYSSEENIIIGNTAFYGAITGEVYIRGLAGERFCIRNSGLNAVIEGVGDHGCEYMTGGRVIILGRTGRNFGAGMSGGIAYVYDAKRDFNKKCNMDMVELETLIEDDKTFIHTLVSNHKKYTGSQIANDVLESFNKEIKKFIKIMPIEYKRILENKKITRKLGLTEAFDG